MQGVALLLHNIRSSHNVGSIFRTADAAGVSRVYLCGYTPTPIDRFGRPQKEIAKTALGAEKNVPWEYHKNPSAPISTLSESGWTVVGVEQDERSQDYRHASFKARTLFVFGNEVLGLSLGLRSRCDLLIEIPMRGSMVRQAHHPRHMGRGKESLNVSVVAGIIIFSAISR